MPDGQPTGQPEQPGAAQQALDGEAAAPEAAAEEQGQAVGSEGAAAAAAAAAASGGGASIPGHADSPAAAAPAADGLAGTAPTGGSSGAAEGPPTAEDSAAMSEQAKGGSPAAGSGAAAAAGAGIGEQGSDAAPCTLMGLPDHLISKCLEPVELAERLTSVAFVCKRLSTLSLCADERCVRIKITGARAVERSRQLLLWLPRHAPSIKYLSVEMAAGPAEGGEAAAEADVAEVDNIAACCLSAFGVLGGGQLVQLTLRDKSSEAMPAQVAALINLEELQLKCRSYSADSMAGISSLPALTNLVLSCFTAMPAGLAGMTQLARLELNTCTDSAPVAGLAAMLTSLTGLWDLWIGGDYASVLPALTALTQLEKLGLMLYTTGPEAEEDVEGAVPAAAAAAAVGPGAAAAPAAAPAAGAGAAAGAAGDAATQPSLPAGSYLSGLLELDVNWPLLANSLPALEQAIQLEYLAMHSVPDPKAAPTEQWDSTFNWLARHPPLQQLHLRLSDDEQISFAAFDALMRLKDRRPGLQLDRGASSWTNCD
ncbi:hypothetical protein C2E21_8154 [Chlorella sorokiniana]|uniref:Uncharacterized protein n=1 Tax=Chlorella sorokiniana TaxID=3076 RepID=A0A2P6TFF2_CHLSO|nr:hypothetical protein C2E21_8154 [Chlorella sorokiniana]|eukprot:PRW32843.1 hypothetical protein C2E21_8154 [Chlorella sorokiniana]